MATGEMILSKLQGMAADKAQMPPQSDDPTADAPETVDTETKLQQEQLNEACKAALLELRRVFKARYQPKRMRFISEGSRAFEALRGNTYALLNDQSAALDTINQLMQGFLGQGDDPSLYAHNDNVYQAFAMIFVAALMVAPGKTRYQPADAQDDEDLAISKKASMIHAFNERKNDTISLQQLELLYLWLTGSYFTYVRHVVDKARAGTSMQDQIEMRPQKISPDGYMCRACGSFVEDTAALTMTASPTCPNCGAPLAQGDWFEGQMLDLPVKVGEIETANGMTAFDVVNGLCIDANPDAQNLRETEILDYTIESAPGKVRSAYPAMYAQIAPSQGSDAASGGDSARMARAGMTTPGSNNRPITADGLGSYSRCWYNPEAFSELQDENVAKELLSRYPEGCKVVLWGDELILDIKAESMLKHWTWCGTVRGLGLYPYAAGKVVMDIQERITGAVNQIHAYMDRVSYGTMLYDADSIDGASLKSKVLTPGNITPVMRTDEETGERVPLDQLFHQMTFQIDAEIYKYPDALTMRAQFLCGVMPQVFGGSDPHVETNRGQERALNTALGRLKQYLIRMRTEKAERASLSVRCSIDNMDEEIRIVQEGDTPESWASIRLLRAELTGDFFTYPETDEGFPATYEEVQGRLMQLLADNQKMPFVMQLLSDPDIAAVVAHYLLPPGLELTQEPERARVHTLIHRLAQDPRGPITKPNPMAPGAPPVVVPSILPNFAYDDPQTCTLLAKKWLLKHWEQEESNPRGFANVLAFLNVCAQIAKEQAMQAAMQQQAAEGAPGQK